MARFAGSQHLDERRRRRLAAGADETEAVTRPRRSSAAADSSGSIVGRGGLSVDNCPVLSCVAPELWKHLAVAALFWAIGALLLTAGWFEQEGLARFGPAYSRLLRLSDARLAGWLGQGLLLLAAQASLLVWWARARSLHDFAGHYSIWGAATSLWLLFSLCLGTGAHRVAADILLYQLNFPIPSPHQTWCWLFPTLLASVWLVLRLEQELRGCRSSHCVLFCAAMCYLTATATHLGLDSVGLLLSKPVQNVIVQGTLLSGHIALLLSMTLHTRYVLFFTAEPTPRRPRRDNVIFRVIAACFRMLWPSFLFKRKQAASDQDDAAEGAARRTRRKSSKRKSTTKTTRTRRTSSDEGDGSDLTDTADSEDETDEDEEEQETRPPASVTTPVAASKPAPMTAPKPAPAPAAPPSPVTAAKPTTPAPTPPKPTAPPPAAAKPAPTPAPQKAPAPTSKPPAAASSPTKSPPPRATVPEPDEDDDDEDEDERPVSTTRKAEPPSGQRPVRIDPPHSTAAAARASDDDDDEEDDGSSGGSEPHTAFGPGSSKGLSKRERRKLKQQQRDTGRGGTS